MAKQCPAEAAISELTELFEKFLISAETRKDEINTKIDSLIQTADARRLQMLTDIDSEVTRVREEVDKKQDTLTQLRQAETDIDINLSANESRESMLNALSVEVDKVDLKLSDFRLKWTSAFTRMSAEIDPLCQLIMYTESAFERADSDTPLWSASLNLGKGNNEIIEAKSVAIDGETGNLYVGDASGRKILILNRVGDFIRTLALPAYPSAIGRMLIHESSIFCHNNSFLPATVLYRLDKNTGALEASYDAHASIKGLAIWENSLYTGAYELTHLKVLPLDLLKEQQMLITSPHIKKSRVLHSTLQDMSAVDGEIVLLISNSEYPIQVYDLSAQLLRCLRLDKYSAPLDAFICVDKHWNIIVTSHADKLVRVYNKKGTEIASVGRYGQDRDGMYYPRCVVLDTDSNLIVCSCKKQYLLQAY